MKPLQSSMDLYIDQANFDFGASKFMIDAVSLAPLIKTYLKNILRCSLYVYTRAVNN